MSKIVKVPKESNREYSWDTWCVQCSCHCAYLAGLTSSKCESCEQKPITTEYIIVEE